MCLMMDFAITANGRKVGEVGMIREYIIKISDEIMEEEIADRSQELVRCKYCKHGSIDSTSYPQFWCSVHSEYHKPEWFCADGERE